MAQKLFTNTEIDRLNAEIKRRNRTYERIEVKRVTEEGTLVFGKRKKFKIPE